MELHRTAAWIDSAIGPRNQYEIAANGITRFGLTGDGYPRGVFPVPPLPEQQAISAFLDRETARIDALVAKKERLIETAPGEAHVPHHPRRHQGHSTPTHR